MRLIYEDAEIVVVDKPAGVLVHPAPGHETGTLSEELAHRFPEMAAVGSAERPGVVHRLDGDTSGVMVFARTPRAYLSLRRQFETHREVRKTYLAVCHGAKTMPDGGTVTTPVGRERLSAVTHYGVLARRKGVALVRFDIETGRMHQIRIHASSLGHPIAGDPLYGDRTLDAHLIPRPQRTLLHAVELSFRHPGTGRRVTFAAPPPADIVHAV